MVPGRPLCVSARNKGKPEASLDPDNPGKVTLLQGPPPTSTLLHKSRGVWKIDLPCRVFCGMRRSATSQLAMPGTSFLAPMTFAPAVASGDARARAAEKPASE